MTQVVEPHDRREPEAAFHLNTDPGLANIWHMDSEPLMAALSLGVLLLMALGALTLAVRVFHRKTMA